MSTVAKRLTSIGVLLMKMGKGSPCPCSPCCLSHPLPCVKLTYSCQKTYQHSENIFSFIGKWHKANTTHRILPMLKLVPDFCISWSSPFSSPSSPGHSRNDIKFTCAWNGTTQECWATWGRHLSLFMHCWEGQRIDKSSRLPAVMLAPLAALGLQCFDACSTAPCKHIGIIGQWCAGFPSLMHPLQHAPALFLSKQWQAPCTHVYQNTHLPSV